MLTLARSSAVFAQLFEPYCHVTEWHSRTFGRLYSQHKEWTATRGVIVKKMSHTDLRKVNEVDNLND